MDIDHDHKMENLEIEIPYYDQCLQIIKNKVFFKFNFKDYCIELDQNKNKRIIYSHDFTIPSEIIDNIFDIKFHNNEVEKIINQNSIRKITYDILIILDKKNEYYNILDNNNLDNNKSIDTLKNFEKNIMLEYESKDKFIQKIRNILDNETNYDIEEKIKIFNNILLKSFEQYIISISNLYELDDSYDITTHFKYACIVVKTILEFQVTYKELNNLSSSSTCKKTEQNTLSFWDYFGMTTAENSLSK